MLKIILNSCSQSPRAKAVAAPVVEAEVWQSPSLSSVVVVAVLVLVLVLVLVVVQLW